MLSNGPSGAIQIRWSMPPCLSSRSAISLPSALDAISKTLACGQDSLISWTCRSDPPITMTRCSRQAASVDVSTVTGLQTGTRLCNSDEGPELDLISFLAGDDP